MSVVIHTITPLQRFNAAFDPVEEPAQPGVFDVGLERAASVQFVGLEQVELAPAVGPVECFLHLMVPDGEELTPAASIRRPFEVH